MADVQLEHGFTKIADEILEQMARIKLSPTQYRILFIVWRFTYGFSRKEHDLTLGFISKATGCDKRQLQRELKGLENRKIIFQKVENGKGRKISFNKNHDEWIGKTAIGEKTVGETDNGEIVNGSIGEIDNGAIGETDNQDIHSFINNIKNNTTTKEPYLILLETFCELHNKFEYHLKRNEREAMRKMVSSEIPLDFVIESMKLVYDAKLSEGQPVTSFLYYDRVIPDIWEREKGGQADVEKHKRPSKVIQSGGHETQGKNKCGEGPLARSIMRRLEQERRDGPIVDQEFINSLPL